GVLGAGHLGKINMKCIMEISDQYELVGFYDPDPAMVKEALALFEIVAFDKIEDLIAAVDVVDVVTPTLSHFECASQALRSHKHVFVEKPMTNTVEEAKSLIKLAHEAATKIQVGHVERFNPAFIAAEPFFEDPRFIETHRLAEFNPRGTDVSVVLDLMIHDIDIVLSVVKGNVKNISASGVAVVSETPDIANARLEFDNGCVANLTASRMSLKNMRKSRFFQRDAYISVDFLEKSSEIVRMKTVVGEPDPFSVNIDLGEGRGFKEIFFEKPEIIANNAIRDELSSFEEAIRLDKTPKVSVDHGYNALLVAYEILEKLELTSQVI
ncbi:MAG: putative dehydrogenase, partial [Flavobacteriales bacterium]